jgi:inosine-uridine nucleoside N-ribohydrolase
VLKLHLDTDLGGDIDDLCALAMVLNWPDVELLAITTVADDEGKRAAYTRYALELTGWEDIPVAAGADLSRLLSLKAGFARRTTLLAGTHTVRPDLTRSSSVFA